MQPNKKNTYFKTAKQGFSCFAVLRRPELPYKKKFAPWGENLFFDAVARGGANGPAAVARGTNKNNSTDSARARRVNKSKIKATRAQRAERSGAKRSKNKERAREAREHIKGVTKAWRKQY